MPTARKTVWKGMRLDEEVVVCMEEALAEGEVSTVVTEAITRHGRLAECRRCGTELPGARRLVDRFCDDCYRAVTPDVLRRYIDRSIPPGKRASRSAVDATRYPEWVYEPASEPDDTKAWRGWIEEERGRKAEPEQEANAPRAPAESRPDDSGTQPQNASGN